MLLVARFVVVSTRAFMAKRHVAYGVAAQPDANLRKAHNGRRKMCETRGAMQPCFLHLRVGLVHAGQRGDGRGVTDDGAVVLPKQQTKGSAQWGLTRW